jgi:nuclear protein localization family protein 4
MKDKKVLRIRSPKGQFRLEYSAETTVEELRRQIDSLLKTNNTKIYYDQGFERELLFKNGLVSALQLLNGQIFYSSDTQPNTPAKTVIKRNYIKQDPLDDLLLKEKGLIKRGRNAMYCRHADNAMCEYCLPLEPYDQG